MYVFFKDASFKMSLKCELITIPVSLTKYEHRAILYLLFTNKWFLSSDLKLMPDKIKLHWHPSRDFLRSNLLAATMAAFWSKNWTN